MNINQNKMNASSMSLINQLQSRFEKDNVMELKIFFFFNMNFHESTLGND